MGSASVHVVVHDSIENIVVLELWPGHLLGVREQLRIVGITTPSSHQLDGDDVTTSPCVKSITVVISSSFLRLRMTARLQRMKRALSSTAMYWQIIRSLAEPPRMKN